MTDNFAIIKIGTRLAVAVGLQPNFSYRLIKMFDANSSVIAFAKRIEVYVL